MSLTTVVAVVGSVVAVVTAAVAVWQAVQAGRSATASRRQAAAAEDQAKLLRQQLSAVREERAERDAGERQKLLSRVLEDGASSLNQCHNLLKALNRNGSARPQSAYEAFISGLDRLNGSLVRLNVHHGDADVSDFAAATLKTNKDLISSFRECVNHRLFGMSYSEDIDRASGATKRLEVELDRLFKYIKIGKFPPLVHVSSDGRYTLTTTTVEFSELPPDVKESFRSARADPYRSE